MDDWEKVESRKRAGVFYYFNRKTGESKWKLPQPKIPISTSIRREHGPPSVPAKPTRSMPPPSPQPSHKPPPQQPKKKPPKLEFVSTASASNARSRQQPKHILPSPGYKPPTPSSASLPTDMDSAKSTASGSVGSEWEEMEWELGAVEEVGMDVDLSEEQQLTIVSEVQKARGELKPGMTPEDLCLPQDPGNYSEKFYFILDTNVLLSHLEFLAKLKECSIKGIGRPVLIIPWVVMQELDHLKDSERVGTKARKAINFLHKAFEAKHPRVRGQTMEEAQSEVHNHSISNNDDRILHCCLFYQIKVHAHEGIVVLFSNDTQLCNKALINNVKAVNRKTLPTELLKMTKHMSHLKPITPVSTPLSPTIHTGSQTPSNMICLQESTVASEVLSKAESLVREGLSVAIRREMVDAYDDLWEQVVVIKPPWDLKDLVYLLDRHWVAVFRLVLPNRVKYDGLIAGLQKYVQDRHGLLPTLRDVQRFIDRGTRILRDFSDKPDPTGVIALCIAELTILADRVENKSWKPLPLTPHPPLTSPPTPPSTPSHDTTLTLTPSTLETKRESLKLLVASQPADDQPMRQLEWLLRVIYQALEYCFAQVVVEVSASPEQRAAVATQFLAPVCDLLQGVVTTIETWLTQGPTIPVIQEMILICNKFFSEVLCVQCPVTMETLYRICGASETRQLLQDAFVNYTTSLDQLKATAVELK